MHYINTLTIVRLAYFLLVHHGLIISSLQETSTNNDNNDITTHLYEGGMMSTKQNLVDPVEYEIFEFFSYTEWFLEKRAGHPINLKKLMLEYSTLCPVQQTCDVDFDEMYLFSGDIEKIPAFSGCSRFKCECDRQCVEEGTCCPGTHFGFVNHNECINIILYPEEERWAFYMASKCLDHYDENNTVVELCKSKIRPCTSKDSGVIYKNQYCAQCNKETECINWKLDVVCLNDRLFPGEFQSYSDMKIALDQYNCIIQYEIPEGTRVGPSCFHRDYLQKIRINKCNVTGLWQHYDADIDWACQNFIVPYKEFSNVFCYICNPSHGNIDSVPLIDTCVTNDNTSDILSNVSMACEDFPASDRLKPFKNVYCYACNNGHTMLYDSTDTEVFFLGEVSEENDHVTLSTQMNLSLVFPFENNINDIKTFVHETLQGTFEITEINSEPYNNTRFHYKESEKNAIINHYISVCGTGNLCFDYNNTDNSLRYSNPVCGRCTCINDCAEYEKCCIDTMISKQPFACFKTGIFPSLSKYVVTNYSKQYSWVLETNSYKVIDTCLNQTHELSGSCSSLDKTSDLLVDIPIRSEGDIAYRNIYCYVCNNEYFKKIVLDLQVYCDTFIEYELFTSLSNLLREIKLRCYAVSFVPVQSRLCVNGYDAVKASHIGGTHYVRKKEHSSKFDFIVGKYVRVQERYRYESVKDVYSKCNMSGYMNTSDHLLTDICEKKSVNILSLPEYKLENKTYKNFACFLCNPKFQTSDMNTEEEISNCGLNSSIKWYERDETLVELCNTSKRNDIWYPYKNMYCAECNLPPWQLVDIEIVLWDVLGPVGYKYLFSLSPEDFENMDAASRNGVIPECPTGTYDHNMKQCRSVFCNVGYELHNFTCRPILETASYHLYELSLKMFITEFDGLKANTTCGRARASMNLEELCSNISQIITNPFGDEAEYYIEEQRCHSSSACEFTQKPSLVKEPLVDISCSEFVSVFYIIGIVYTEKISTIRAILVDALNRRYNATDLYDVYGNSHSILFETAETRDTELLNPGESCLIGRKNFVDVFNPDIHYSSFTVNRFLLCAFVKLNVSEATIYQNELVLSIEDRNATFHEHEFKIVDNNVHICITDFNQKTLKPTNEYASQTNKETYFLNIFTLVCTVISLVSIFLTFMTYCFFSSLRTLPGKCIMLLCFSLFFSQTFLQFGITGKAKSILCILTGVCIHYFWISFFCATHICSFHMFKVFCFSELTLPRNERRLFMKYLLYCISFPLALVLTTVLINILEYDTLNIGYGANYCFISDFYIFVGTFLTPACIVFLNNVIFFALAFHRIRSATNVQSNQDKNNFYIFMKLFTIVGITWPLFIIDNVLQVYWLSFVVSGINSLQGVFIFASFILNRRVMHLYMSALTKV